MKKLARFFEWLAGKIDPIRMSGCHLFIVDPLALEKADEVVAKLRDGTGSGEFKRDRAYKALRRALPDHSGREISKAIEMAVDRVG